MCQRIGEALVSVTGAAITRERLGSFLEELRDSHETLADPVSWPAPVLAAAFSRRFGVAVTAERYAVDTSPPGVAFHIRVSAASDATEPAEVNARTT